MSPLKSSFYTTKVMFLCCRSDRRFMLISGVPYKEMAVLYRSNRQSAISHELETAFLHAKVPYAVIRGQELFGRRGVRDLLAVLTLLVNHRDEWAFERLFRRLPGLGLRSWNQFLGGYTRYVAKASKEPASATSVSKSLVSYLGRVILSWRQTSGHKSKQQQALSNLRLHIEKWTRFANKGCGLAVLVRQLMTDLGLKQTHGGGLGLDPFLSACRDYDRDATATQQSMDGSVKPSLSSVDLPDAKDAGPSLNAKALRNIGSFLEYIRMSGYVTTNSVAQPEAAPKSAGVPDEKELGKPADVVTLSTIHAAKGLEWRAVFCLQLVEGVFPVRRRNPEAKAVSLDHERAQDDELEDVAEAERRRLEERRLFYVLASRPKDHLYLCYSDNGYHGKGAGPSTFLTELRKRYISQYKLRSCMVLFFGFVACQDCWTW
jgi:superfamily I DNA/RNA helicase